MRPHSPASAAASAGAVQTTADEEEAAVVTPNAMPTYRAPTQTTTDTLTALLKSGRAVLSWGHSTITVQAEGTELTVPRTPTNINLIRKYA